MEKIFECPGFHHIAYKILTSLDSKNQIQCRKVSKAWKNVLDDTSLNYKHLKYLIKKCFEKKIFVGCETNWEIILKSMITQRSKSTLRFQLESILNRHSKFTFTSPLSMFVITNDLKLIRFIIENNLYDESDLDPQRPKQTALHEAVFNGHVEIVKYLKEFMSPFHPDGRYETPIHLAAKKGYFEMIKIFVPNAKIPLTKNNEGKFAFHLAAQFGHFEIVEYFIENLKKIAVKSRNAEFNVGAEILFETIDNGYFKIVNLIMDHVNFKHVTHNSLRSNGRKLIHKVAQHGTLEILMRICAQVPWKSATYHSKDDDGHFPIHVAAEYGHLDMVKFLIKETIVKDNFVSVKKIAWEYGHEDIVDFIDYHLAKDNGDYWKEKCENLQKEADSKSKVKDSTKIHECSLCGTSFKMESSLTIHLMKCHKANTFVQDQDKGFQCKDCLDQKTSFTCERELERHRVQWHFTTLNPRVCETCGKSYISDPFLRLHIARDHPEIKQEF